MIREKGDHDCHSGLRNVKPSQSVELPKRLTAMAIPRINPTKSHFFFTFGKRRAVARGEKNLKTFFFLDFASVHQ